MSYLRGIVLILMWMMARINAGRMVVQLRGAVLCYGLASAVADIGARRYGV